jgi:hypothetical protein
MLGVFGRITYVLSSVVLGVTVISPHVAESLFRATLSIFGMRGQLSEALRIINCLRALARVFVIQQNEADVPEMLTEPGKWPDGDTLLFEGTSETRH